MYSCDILAAELRNVKGAINIEYLFIVSRNMKCGSKITNIQGIFIPACPISAHPKLG